MKHRAFLTVFHDTTLFALCRSLPILYACTVHAAVSLLYREGLKIRPQYPPMVGQLRTDNYKGVDVLNLYTLDWLENAPHGKQPLAVLWHPQLVRVGHAHISFRGMEAVVQGSSRRWHVQKWMVDVLDAQRAKTYLGPDLRYGEVKPTR